MTAKNVSIDQHFAMSEYFIDGIPTWECACLWFCTDNKRCLETEWLIWALEWHVFLKTKWNFSKCNSWDLKS